MVDFHGAPAGRAAIDLNELAEEASEAGLYEPTLADYAAALKSARRRSAPSAG